jgi:hypothetical protein
MIHVEITNFQSIRHLSFDIDGFTTIVGRNFIGKSAVLRAINAALTNASGTGFITWGESFCEVRLKNDKIDLLWHKEEGNNFYVVNDKKYSKIGRDDPPDEVLDAGLGPTTIGKDKLNLLYVEQFFPLFLVDKKDSRGIDLLTAAYGLDRVYKAIDLCNKDQRSNKDMLRIRKKDLAILSEDIKKYDGFEEVLDKKSSLIAMKKSLEQKERNIERLKDLLRKISLISQQVKSLQDIRGIDIPEDTKLKDIFSKSKRLTSLSISLSNTVAVVNRLKDVEGIEVPEGVTSIKSLNDKITKVSNFVSRLTALSASVKRLEAITIIDLPVINAPKTDLIETLESYRKKLIDTKMQYDSTEKKYESIKEEEKTLLKEKEDFKGICPLCGNELKDCEDKNE